ncbi:MAG: ribonuclease H-like domain-containing protein [Planctomycetes bacterium]|nr:ribonuclease H-like domain-containing protein [Planctomycetota bacterium]
MATEPDAFRDRLKRKLGLARGSAASAASASDAASAEEAAPAPSDAAAAPLAPPAPAPPPKPRAEAALLLERMFERRAKRAASAPAPRERAPVAPLPRGPARPLPSDLASRTNARGEHAELERRFEEPRMQEALQRLRTHGSEVLRLHAQRAELPPFELARAAFLDTETTALHGGAGCTVFLIGVGLLEEGALRVHQVFLRSPSDEAAALARVLELLREVDVLVSFHGKSFDRHRLHARLAMLGFESPLLRFPHLDLGHIARRFYRGELRDQRLQTLEREVLGLHREDDLPGSQCPAAWFAHVGGRPSRIGDVFEHNALDVASLALLAARFAAPPTEASSGREWLSYARGLRLAERRDEARAALERAIAKLNADSADYLRAQEEARRLRPARARGSPRAEPPA